VTVSARGELTYRWVTTDVDLARVVEQIAAAERYALDTEFHREKTYFPKLALLQIAVGSELLLIDPLRVDVRALAPAFGSDALAVLHAAQQDLDVLTHAVGAVPRRLWDTQVGAGFLGYGTPSLMSLLQGELSVTPLKGDRLTDWLRRPLTEAQCQYAASDVAYLLEVFDKITDQLAALGRQEWADQACADLLSKPISGSRPEEAWLRLKDVRTLRPPARAVAQSIAAWRERRAMASDIPVRHVLADLAVLGIAQRQPGTVEELRQARGVDERSMRGGFAEELLAAVAEGSRREPPDLPQGTEDIDKELRPAITLISAWVSQLARTERIDSVLLATRADLVAFLRGDPDARLRSGWRAALLGDGISALIEGRAALTFTSASAGNGQRRNPKSNDDTAAVSGLRLVDLTSDQMGNAV
jgi:ribonuclease D